MSVRADRHLGKTTGLPKAFAACRFYRIYYNNKNNDKQQIELTS